MSHFSLRLAHFGITILAILSVYGCTLDFEEFTPYTEENLRNRSQDPSPEDMNPPDMMDMIMKEDMRPPLEDVDPPDILDVDEDGVLDNVDNCLEQYNPDQLDTDGNAVGDACDDADADGVLDYYYDVEAENPYTPRDNCLGLSNPDQLDLDRDGEGDACDLDIDGDGLDATQEQARATDPLKMDSDDDGWRDDVDYCPLYPSRDNRDLDQDGYGDDCDADDDDDGIYDWLDNCPFAYNPNQEGEDRGTLCSEDADSDGLADDMDPCPFEPNVEGATPSCVLGVKRWGYEGDHYDLELSTRNDLFAATRGGLRLIDPPENQSSWGEEYGLPSRDVRQVKSVTHPLIAMWLMMYKTQSLSVLRWDRVLSRYYPIEIPLATLNISGDPQAISAYQGSVWIGTSTGLYHLDADGVTSLDLQSMNPSVTALYTSDDGQTFIAAGSELFRYVADGQIENIGNLTEYGDIKAIKPIGEEIAVLGSLKTALLSHPLADQQVQVLDSFDLVADDMIQRPDGYYFATAQGVIYIDLDHRTYLPNTRQPGGTVTRSLEPSSLTDRWWVASSGVATEFSALWNGYSIANEPCIRDHRIKGSDLWVATTNGFYRISALGEKQRYGDEAEQGFYVVESSTDNVWSAGASHLIQVLADYTTSSYLLPDGVIAPIMAMSEIGDRLWIGGYNSVAYATLTDNTLGEWTVIEADGESLPYGQVVGIKAQGEIIWTSVKGDQTLNEGGLARYDLNLGSFIPPPYTVGNGGINSHQIYDLDYYGDVIALASNLGARVLGFFENLAISNVNFTGGIPNEAGNTYVFSLGFTPSYLFLSLKPTAADPQPYGSIVRLSHSVAEFPINIDSTLFYSSQDTDILTVPEADLTRTRIHYLSTANGNPQISYSSCGSDTYPGLVGILDGQAGIRQRVTETKLKIPADLNVLIPSPSTHPTWAQSYRSPEGELSVYLTDLADDYPNPYGNGDPRARRKVETLTHAIQSCQKYEVIANPGQYNVECLLEGNYFATNLNESWNVYVDPMFANTPTEVRSFVIDQDKPSTIRWYATNRGLIQRRSPTVFDEDFSIQSSPEEALITDLYAVYHSQYHGLLFVGSDQGVHFSPLVDGNLSQQLWTSVAELKGTKVYDLAEDPTSGALWVATAKGLFKVTLTDGAVEGVSYYGGAQGLPNAKISRVATSEEGDVFALHQSGLSMYRQGNWSHHGARQGTSREATQLLVTGGYVWVGGSQGVTRFSY